MYFLGFLLVKVPEKVPEVDANWFEFFKGFVGGSKDREGTYCAILFEGGTEVGSLCDFAQGANVGVVTSKFR